jgi:glucose-fructose oxidoreductase
MKKNRPDTPVSRRRFLGQLSAAAVALASVRSRASAAPVPAKKLGIALVGLGNYSENLLLPAIRQSDYWKLTGVVTGSREKGERWAKANGFPSRNVFSYDTMDRIAGNPDIDVVYVVTPNALHAENTIAAARAGKHVICEKPMAVSVAECDAMIQACRDAKVRLMIGYRLHYEPHHAEFARLSHDDALGPFMKINGENSFDMGDPGDEAPNWRVNPKLAGGGPLMDMGVYVIQAVCMARQEAPPVAVTAKFGKVTRPRLFSKVEQSIEWTMEYSDGAKATCYSSYCDQKSTVRAEGPKGWAEIPYPAFYYDKCSLVTSRGTPALASPDHQVAQMNGLAAELLENRPSLAPGEMGRRDVAIIEAVYAAARSGRRTEVRV